MYFDINFDGWWWPEKIKDSQNTAGGEKGGQNGTSAVEVGVETVLNRGGNCKELQPSATRPR